MYQNIRIDDRIRSLYNGINLPCATVETRISTSYELNNYLDQLSDNFSVSKESLKDHPTVRALRDFYWRMGIDPTKTRPSSEALARRFLSNGQIPKINSIVDAGNLASIETLVPIGIYDAHKINGEPVLREANHAECFVDISQHEHMLTGNEVVLADSEGIMHLFPHRDSYRTMVREDTKQVLIVGCGVPGIATEQAEAAVKRTLELMKELGK